jgi:transcription elongation factor Elf1
MSDNMLKREFRERDVQRMRNIITKDYGAKTGTQIGYTKEYVERKEGDVWEENSKTWTIKNGIKMTVTKLDLVKKSLQMPLTCPNCNQPMNKGRLDKTMYSIHKQCSDCVIKYETELKRQGKFEEYQQNINKQSIVYHIKEMENVLLELALNQSEESFVTEAGDIESWKGKGIDQQKLIQDIQEYIQKLKDVISS